MNGRTTGAGPHLGVATAVPCSPCGRPGGRGALPPPAARKLYCHGPGPGRPGRRLSFINSVRTPVSRPLAARPGPAGACRAVNIALMNEWAGPGWAGPSLLTRGRPPARRLHTAGHSQNFNDRVLHAHARKRRRGRAGGRSPCGSVEGAGRT